MKKVILSLVFLFSIVIIGTAQTSTDSVKFHWGVRAGAGIGKITGSSATAPAFDSKMKIGGYIGVFGEYKLSSVFGIQPEVNLNTFNVETAASNGGLVLFQSGVKKTLYYADVPVLLKINASPVFSFVVGPQVSAILNNPNESDNSNNWYLNGKKGNTFKTMNFSAVGGIQLAFGHVRLQARYIAGITNIANYNIQTYTQNQSWRSSQVQIGLAYAIF